MKVVSPLANLDMYVGGVRVQDGQLLIESAEESTMPAEVFISPQDVRAFLRALLTSPRGLVWALTSVFRPATSTTKQVNRLQDPLNKPW